MQKEKDMTKNQISELAALQTSIFNAVVYNDQDKLQQQLDTTLFWIRKQAWKQVQFVMLDCDDPVVAANFQAKEIKLGENTVATFYVCQSTLIENLQEGADVDIRLEAWLKYVRWVGKVIDSEASKKTGRYIKVRVKRKK
jgi:hypothetical protein